MEFDLAKKESEPQSLQKRIHELERQLADARAALLAPQSENGQNGYSSPSRSSVDVPFSSEEGIRRALLVAPYPLMIWREDGRVIMVNTAFTQISGYTLEDIPTYEEWSHKALGERFSQQSSVLFYEEFLGQDVKKTREIEITTRSGEKRIWDFSDAVLGTDQDERWLMMTMAVDITERRQVEDQLEQNEQLFFVIFDKAPYAAALSKLPEGIITNINEEFEQVFGYSRHEILGRTSLETGIHPDPDGRARILAEIQTRGSARNVEALLHTKSGEARIFLLNLDQVNIQGQQYIFQTAQDITEQKRAEETLKEMTRLLDLDRTRLSTILEHLPVGVWIGDQEGRLISKNKQADRIWAGAAPLVQNIEDSHQYQSWHPGNGMPLRAEEYPMALALQTSQPVEPVELKIRRFDGSDGTVLVSAVPIMDGQGRLTGVVAVNVDITERKRVEEELRNSEERFSKAFHKSPFGMNITRWRDGVILDANDAWLNLLGWTREEILGKTTVDFPFYAHSEDRTWVRERITKDDVPGDMELHVIRKDGAELLVNVATTIIELQGERCILGVLNDITERKKAEEALQRFQLLSEHSRDIILFMRFQDGHILEANVAAVQAYGYSHAELLGLTISDLRGTGTSNLRAEQMTQANESGILFETIHRRKDGSSFPVEVSSQGATIGGIRTLVSIVRDITERKKVEKALEASDAKMRAVFRSLTEGVVFLNRSGEVEEANDAVQLSYGHTVEELSDPELDPRTRIIRPDGTLFPVDEQPGIYALRTGETVRNVEMGVPTLDGQISWRLVNAQPVLDDKGSLLGVVASFFDITERRRAEQALRESEQRFRSLADSMPQLVWTALPDGRVDYYNQRHLEYQDIKQVEAEDWDWAPVLHPEDMQATVDAWVHSVETGEVYQIEHRVRMTDDSYRWHLSRGVPMLDEKGRIIRWFGTSTDIHDLKLAEEQLKLYANRLEQSNRELEQFAFMASHDLQEPLRKIEMFGDLLLERAKSLQENERTYLDRMRNAAGRMRAMIEGLLQISRVATQGKPFVRVDLSRVTKEVLSDFEDQIKHSGARMDIGRLPSVTGDPLQLRQLLQNLIGNAIKYRQPGKPPEIRIYAEQLPDKVQICIQDRGIGFPQEDADRIFEPFQRLVGRNQYEGSGIGLAICRRIVERHGGEIAAMSEPGNGTTFFVTLPNPPLEKSKRES